MERTSIAWHHEHLIQIAIGYFLFSCKVQLSEPDFIIPSIASVMPE